MAIEENTEELLHKEKIAANNNNNNNEVYHETVVQKKKISSLRRLTPQVIVAVIKSLIIVNKNLFDGLSTLVIASLVGIATDLNPNETIHISASEASWLSSLTLIGHPFGSVLSGLISDKFGRRRALMIVVAPAVLAFIMLGSSHSFILVCLSFFSLSFIFGLKDAPSMIYISEIAEPSVRGTLLAFIPIARYLGQFIVYLLGSFLSWRQVAFTCSAVPVIIVIAICFIPESPNWLLSRDRPKDAVMSLQWLRGCVSAEYINDEFTKLQNHSIVANTCGPCTKQLIECPHPRPTFFEKLKEVKRKRVLKPFILTLFLNFFLEFSLCVIWRSYIIQVLKAFGMPGEATHLATILSFVNIAGSCCFLFSVKMVGKRRLYLSSTIIVVLCSIGLSVFGFIFFPSSNWTSFQNSADTSITNFDLIRRIVGNYGYLALILLVVMQFCTVMGLSAVPPLVCGEIFSFKLRSFLCGLTLAIRYIFASIAVKTYYNMEVWLSLPGTILFYGIISFIGSIIMFLILPETEQRSLEDIELHYVDNTKKITDIRIEINGKTIEIEK